MLRATQIPEHVYTRMTRSCQTERKSAPKKRFFQTHYRKYVKTSSVPSFVTPTRIDAPLTSNEVDEESYPYIYINYRQPFMLTIPRLCQQFPAAHTSMGKNIYYVTYTPKRDIFLTIIIVISFHIVQHIIVTSDASKSIRIQYSLHE